MRGRRACGGRLARQTGLHWRVHARSQSVRHSFGRAACAQGGNPANGDSAEASALPAVYQITKRPCCAALARLASSVNVGAGTTEARTRPSPTCVRPRPSLRVNCEMRDEQPLRRRRDGPERLLRKPVPQRFKNPAAVFSFLGTLRLRNGRHPAHPADGCIFPIIDKRPYPGSRGDPTTDRIVAIEFAGPVTALARVECSVLPMRFIDLLTLVHIDGRWRLIWKVFHDELAQGLRID